MNPLDASEIGSTGVRVTRLGLGGAPIGSNLVLVTDDVALQIVRRAFELGIQVLRHRSPVRTRQERALLRRGAAGA